MISHHKSNELIALHEKAIKILEMRKKIMSRIDQRMEDIRIYPTLPYDAPKRFMTNLNRLTEELEWDRKVYDRVQEKYEKIAPQLYSRAVFLPYYDHTVLNIAS